MSGSASRALAWNNNPPIADTAEVARRLRGLRGVTVDVRWRYKRAGVLRPRRRESKERQMTITVDAEEFRRAVGDQWRLSDEYRVPLDILDGLSEGGELGDAS